MGTTLTFQAPSLEAILEWKEFQPSKKWFENEIRLLSGKVLGRYDADRMPHVDRIFEEIDKLSVNMITLMTASQTSKTTVGVGTIFKYADTEPADSLIMFPRESELKKMYENKVKKLLDGCDTLLDKIKQTQAEDRKKGKDLLIKVNGIVINILATNNTKSISTKYNYYDEVVEFPIGKLEEAMERAKSFNESGEKFLITSTQHPTRGGDDQINFYFNIAEVKLQYWAYCPSCKEHYYPEPETLVYPSIEEWKRSVGLEEDAEVDVYRILSEYGAYVRDNAKLKCPNCSHKIDNHERKKLILDRKFQWFKVEPNAIDENNIVTSWKKAEQPKSKYKSVGFDINTLAIESYNMGDIAKDIVQAEYSRSKIAKLQMIYVGYFNRVYRANIKKRKPEEILLLTNKLPTGIVPKNTAKLYFIADTQKDHWWWMVVAVQWGKKFNVVAHGKAAEWQTVKELAFRSWKTESGESRYADRATVDMRGYQRAEETDADGNVTQTEVNTTEKMKERVVEANSDARSNGFAKRDEFFFIGTMGQEKIKISDKELEEADKRGEAPTGEMCVLKTIEDKDNPDFTYKVLHISNLAAKTELFQAINDNIDNFKNEAEGKNIATTSNLFFISDDMAKEGLNRANPRNEDLEKMLTAEIYDYDVKNGKMKPYKSFIQIRKRNDHLDNAATAVALASLDNIALDAPQETIINPMEFNPFAK
jgi:hypothetical protein